MLYYGHAKQFSDSQHRCVVSNAKSSFNRLLLLSLTLTIVNFTFKLLPNLTSKLQSQEGFIID